MNLNRICYAQCFHVFQLVYNKILNLYLLLFQENSKGGEIQTKDNTNKTLFTNLFKKVQENATRIADVLIECKINIDKVTTIKYK